MPVDSVEGAARHTQRITEAPASVTVVTATDIETFGWRTLADVLKSVRGFHVTYDRNYSYVGVRAFGRPTDYNNRVLVMVDGRRLNDSIYDAALVGTDFPLDLSVVERVEVIRGPGSALYGTSAFLAVVNVITKRGNTAAARQAGVDASSFGTWNAHASHGWSDDRGRDVFLSASRYDTARPARALLPRVRGRAGRRHGVRPRRGQEQPACSGPRASADCTSRGRSPNAKSGCRRRRGRPTSATRGSSPATRAHGSARRTCARRAGVTIQGRGYYDHYDYYGDYPGEVVSFDGAKADTLGAELSLRRRFGRHAITTGVDQRTNLRQDQWNGDAAVMYVDDHRSSHEVAAYVQDEIALTPGSRRSWAAATTGGATRAAPGARASGSSTAPSTTPRSRRSTAKRIGRPTSTSSTTAATRVKQAGNAALGPEVARTTELVVERHVTRRLRLGASAYHTRIEGPHRSVLPRRRPHHLPEQRVGALARRGVRGRIALALGAVRPRQRGAAARQLRRRPARSRTRRAGWARCSSRCPSGAGSSWWPATPSSCRRDSTVAGDRLPDYCLSNLTATYRPLRWPIVVGATIYNAFDQAIDHPVGVEFRQASLRQDGRTAALRLTVKF